MTSWAELTVKQMSHIQRIKCLCMIPDSMCVCEFDLHSTVKINWELPKEERAAPIIQTHSNTKNCIYVRMNKYVGENEIYFKCK